MDRKYVRILSVRYTGVLDCVDCGVGCFGRCIWVHGAAVTANLGTKRKITTHSSRRLIRESSENQSQCRRGFPDAVALTRHNRHSSKTCVRACHVGFNPHSKLGIELRDAHQLVPDCKENFALSIDWYCSSLQPSNFKSCINWTRAINDNLCQRAEYQLHPGSDRTETEFDL